MAAKRIYVVSDGGIPEGESLVKASTPAQAIGFVVRERYSAEVASQEQLVTLIGAGIKVQEAGEE